MNPFLAAVVIALMVLNFVWAVSLIDWRNLPDAPMASANPPTSQATAPGPGASATMAAPSRRVAAPTD